MYFVFSSWESGAEKSISTRPYNHYYTTLLKNNITHGDRPKYLIDKIPEGKNIHKEENMYKRKRIQL